MERVISGIIVVLLLIGMLALAFDIQPTKARVHPQSGSDLNVTIPDFNSLMMFNQSIQLGMEYLNRLYYQCNSTYAVCKECPYYPIRVYDVGNNKWLMPEKYTGEIQQKASQCGQSNCAGYYGSGVFTCTYMGYDYTNYTIAWDTAYDNTYTGMTMTLQSIAVNATYEEITVKVTSLTTSSPLDVYLNDQLELTDIHVGSTFNATNAYGWASVSYHCRHITRILANIYAFLGDSTLGSTNGHPINYTQESTYLDNTWSTAYTMDPYDAIFPTQSGCDNYPSGWLSCSAINQIGSYGEYSLFPDPFTWNNLPWFPDAIPYKSALDWATADDFFINFAWQTSAAYMDLQAMDYMNRYGINDLSAAKSLLDESLEGWNGLGIDCAWLPGGIPIQCYSCYETDFTAVLLCALCKYYMLTGDNYYGNLADQVAGVILGLQVRPGVPVATTDGPMLLPSNTGGFIMGYVYQNGQITSEAWGGELYDYAYDFAEGVYKYTGGWLGYIRDINDATWSEQIPTQGESSALCVAALLLYSKLKRIPDWVDPEFVFSNGNATITTSESSGFGGTCGAYANNQGDIRLEATSAIAGTSKAQATYSWKLSVPSGKELTNVNFELAFNVHYESTYTPLIGGDWLGLYIIVSNSTGPLGEYFEKVLSNPETLGYTDYYYANNQIIIPGATTLSSGTYTVQLIFHAETDGSAALYIGWLSGPFARSNFYNCTEPMNIQTFGYDATDPNLPYNSARYVQFPTLDLGHAS